jgi:hypothetical protein
MDGFANILMHILGLSGLVVLILRCSQNAKEVFPPVQLRSVREAYHFLNHPPQAWAAP